MVRSIVSILFVFIVTVEAILPGMDTFELSKIPDLLYHYEEHSVKDPSISFLNFLDLHYDDLEHHKQDPGNHHKLPFSNHHNHNCQLHQVVFMVPDVIDTPDLFSNIITKDAHYTTPKLSSIHVSIWQPPKFI